MSINYAQNNKMSRVRGEARCRSNERASVTTLTNGGRAPTMLTTRMGLPVKHGNRLHDVPPLGRGQLRIDRDRQNFARGALRFRTVLGSIAEVAEAFLQVQRNRVVDLGPDAGVGEIRLQLVASLHPQHVLVEDVPVAPTLPGRHDAIVQSQTLQGGVVPPGVLLSKLGPAIEIAQLHEQHRRLKLVEPEVAADHFVVIPRSGSMDAQDLEARSQGRIVRGAQATVPEGAEILAGKEREAPDIADAAGAPAAGVRGSDSLRRVFDDLQAVPRRQLHEALHVRHLAK